MAQITLKGNPIHTAGDLPKSLPAAPTASASASSSTSS